MSLKRNLIANYLGQGWTALMSLAFVPVYIKYLGMEAYGLIGLFAVMQAWFSLLDLGLTPTLNREVARYTAGAHSADAIRDLVRTFEVLCWAVAASIAVVLCVASGWIASDWLNAHALRAAEVARAIALMGMVVALRFVEELYRGALLGFQEHVWLNLVSASFATLRGLGAVVLLMRFSPTIQAFFIWQAAVSAATVLVLRWGVLRKLPATAMRAAFSARALADVWRFAGGMLLTTILAVLLTQIDKIVLSRVLSLERFGNYMFASTVAGALFQLIGPVAQSYFPRFTELVARGDEKGVAAAYHQGAQLMTIMLVPAGLALVAFGRPLILAWTRSEMVADSASPIVAVLAMGTIFNGWMHIPYMMQLAHGWTSLTVWVNTVAALFLVPAIIIAVRHFGPIGAAWAWFAVNAGYVLIEMHLMHARLLRGEKRAWYLKDVAIPAAAAGAAMLLAVLLQPATLGRAGSVFWTLCATTAAFVLATCASPRFRPYLLRLAPGHRT
jgi:O-antigen/teichoic acid export membrane protein